MQAVLHYSYSHLAPPGNWGHKKVPKVRCEDRQWTENKGGAQAINSQVLWAVLACGLPETGGRIWEKMKLFGHGFPHESSPFIVPD